MKKTFMKQPTEKDLITGLQQAWIRLKDVQKRKNEAISAYDLIMGYDWFFYTKGNCPLLRNHVWYYIMEIRELRSRTKSVQLDLFSSPVSN
jgi:hypothetical protein